MSSVRNIRASVQDVLQWRPYLRWDLIPLASYLIEQGYSNGARNAIVDGVASGLSLQHLVASWDLEPADLDGAEEAMARGRRRARKGRRVQTIGDLLNVLVGSLRACGVETEESSLDATGFDLRIGGGPLRLALIPPVAGGGPPEFDAVPPEPEEFDDDGDVESDAELLARLDRQDAAERARIEREYPVAPEFEEPGDDGDTDEGNFGGMLDHLTDEQVDALAAEWQPADEAELMPEDFALEPPDAPDDGMSRSAALGELLRTGHVQAPPRISGGAPYQPTAEDWLDYREHMARVDAAEDRRREQDRQYFARFGE